MRKSFVLFLALLLTLSLTAAAADSPRLLVAVPDGQNVATLRLEIHVGGQLFVDDVLTLHAGARGGTFEFLERDPARVARLAQLGAGNREATVRLSANGNVFRTLALRDFLAGASLLELAKPQISLPTAEDITFGLEAGPAAPAKAAPRAKTNTTCEEGCQLDRQWCYDNTEECQFVRFCDTCDSQYSQCLASCQQSNDDDNDGLANFADNCPSTSNPGQEDCDGDGIGDACDSFNGTSEVWSESQIDYVWGPVYMGCDGPWRWYYYDVYSHRTDYQRDTYCNGTVVTRSQTTYYATRYYGQEFDPVYCGWYTMKSDDGAAPAAPAMKPVMPAVQFRDGQFWFGERQLPAPEGARYEQRFGATYLVRDGQAWQLVLEPYTGNDKHPAVERLTPQQ